MANPIDPSSTAAKMRKRGLIPSPGDELTLELDEVETRAENFRCEQCGGTFEKGWSDEDAEAERGAEFPSVPHEECALVCGDCYNQMMAWFRSPDGYNAVAEELGGYGTT